MTTVGLAPATDAREEVKRPQMVTPRYHMRWTNDGGVDVLRPGRDHLVASHPVVARNRSAFRIVAAVERPGSREWWAERRKQEAASLRAELRDIQRRLADAPATATARAIRSRSSSRWLSPEPWRLPTKDWRLPCRTKPSS